MENKKPINIFNGLKSKVEKDFLEKIDPVSNLITIQSYQNSKNISKPFVKPISKII
ncbi:hypothetical protein SAMN05444671_4516 [Flavobacterium sp. CF108]|uniref:hypothetical protein n=1 Tax=unclassified Flavobacterium TaxID=196869 RepID=UPI0008C98D0D|nr:MULTISPECIES: hypothetical protein [unclassified Flavobacterium]SEP04803.1 hypothetical protein SAMN04487978_4302 [Flavobacterium sp. fv08]SHH97173.1 hypothetical protein SAMN05444671_4516 [Flavobacterium sp. CF108]